MPGIPGPIDLPSFPMMNRGSAGPLNEGVAADIGACMAASIATSCGFPTPVVAVCPHGL